MDKKRDEGRWKIDEDEEEALSLCDLPLIHQPIKDEKEKHNSLLKETQPYQHFDFCSMFKQESEMCAADEVFFQGQILPQRHSISSERDLSLQRQQRYKQQRHNKISDSRSESMGHHSCYSSRNLVSSSRSSSMNSNSASSTSTNTLPKQYSQPKSSPLPGNPFQYNQPSPSPRLTRDKKGITNCSVICSNKSNHDHPKKLMSPSSSSAWNIFKLGLVTTPPEIFDARPCWNNKNIRGSRNNNSCTNSSFSGSFGKKKNTKKQIKAGLFGGACKCSSRSVGDPLRDSRMAVMMMKRSTSESSDARKSLSDDDRDEEDENDAKMMALMMRSLKMRKEKQLASYHRTSEWLKQLSIEGRNIDDLL